MLRLLALCVFLAPTALAQRGTCLAGDCRSGDGVLETSQGTVYSGRFEAGRLAGPVRITFATGDTLAVGYQRGQANGPGVYRYADGRTFEGTYARGERDGPGTLTELDGSVHRATWDGGTRRGVGRVTFPNGDLFIGWWGGMLSFGGGRSEYRTRTWIYRWASSGATWRASYSEGVPDPGTYRAGGDSLGVGMLDRRWDGASPVPPPDTVAVADTAGVFTGALRADGMRRQDGTFVAQILFEVPEPERFHTTRLRVDATADNFAPILEWLDASGDAAQPDDVLARSYGANWLLRVTSAEPGTVGPFTLRWSAPSVR